MYMYFYRGQENILQVEAKLCVYILVCIFFLVFQVAEKYLEGFSKIAQESTTVLLPANPAGVCNLLVISDVCILSIYI